MDPECDWIEKIRDLNYRTGTTGLRKHSDQRATVVPNRRKIDEEIGAGTSKERSEGRLKIGEGINPLHLGKNFATSLL